MPDAPAKMIVFDLGGVMVRIARTWGAAADRAKVSLGRPERAQVGLTDLPCFEPFQAQQSTFEEYLCEVQSFLGLRSIEEARRVHDAILLDPYPGTYEMVSELHSLGWRTGCLSNTNAPHWRLMSDPSHYPAIAALQVPGLSHEIGVGKPDAAIFSAFESLSGCSPKEIVFFEDTAVNASAARERGWEAHVVDYSADTAAQMRLILGL